MSNDKLELIMQLKAMAKFGKHLPGLIHNLNTPLMGISGRVELIGFKQPDLKGLDQIRTQLDVINDMLTNYSGLLDKDKNRFEQELSIKDFVETIHTFFRTNMIFKHKTKVETQINFEGHIKTVQGVLQNIIVELINNALDAMGEGGSLKIITNTESDRICLMIENAGTKVSEDIINNLDKPFKESTSNQLGMGLYTCNELAKQINAKLFIRNIDGGVQAGVLI